MEIVKVGAEWSVLRAPAVSLVLHGELCVRSDDGEQARLGAGDLLCLGTGAQAELGGRNAGAELVVFHPDRLWLERARALAGGDPGTTAPRIALERAGSDLARGAAHLFRSAALRRPPSEPGAALRDAALRLGLLAIATQSRSPLVDAPVARRPGAARRRRFAQEVTALEAEERLEDVSLASFAQRLGLSERQVTRLFREELGVSFGEHRTRLRLARAKRFLAETRLSVVEIAATAGFASLAHFNAVFRRRVGVTPTAFRAAAHTGSPVSQQDVSRSYEDVGVPPKPLPRAGTKLRLLPSRAASD